MHHDVGSVLEGPDEVGRRDGVVDDERDAVGPGDLRDGGDVDEVVLRVRDRLDEDRLRLGPDQPFPLVAVGGVAHIVGEDAETRERAVEEDARAAVDARGREDVLARPGEPEQQRRDRRLTRTHDDRARAALERGDAALRDLVGRIEVARIQLPLIGAGEARFGLGEVVEEVCRRQVDRRDACVVVALFGFARVHLPGVEAELVGVRAHSHRLGRAAKCYGVGVTLRGIRPPRVTVGACR